ncbi:DNA repair exonuclease [Alicyclobacillus tolerans]|uniref:metallophosphoesterase family protein n=1 Tax=Alicyclobacillus tolerans TaxID=90970 RepID=UPI001F2238A4|nr:DNA repair exonuclease [Alicyclobacillus tolerans]MCF8564260.1 DNA repair exonuclease [Alicyclobacillus tolerans]
MFKFVHCADLHLDSPLRGLSNKEDAPEDQIRSATRKALLNLVDLCIEEGVNFLVIAGDVYDGEWQDYSTGLFFNSCMAKLSDRDIPVYLISGNHDAASNISRRLVLPQNVIQFSVDAPETYVIDDLGVALHGQGFKHREVRENLALSYPPAVPGYFNIGVLHTSADGREGHETYAPCRVEDLVEKGYDYWALGHIHKREVLHENPYVLFSGNLQGRHIRETGEKGCTLVTVDGGRVTLEHRPVDVLRWHECLVDLSDAHTDDDFTSLVSEAMDDVTAKNAGYPLALRIRLVGTTQLHGRLREDMEKYHNEVRNAAAMVAQDLIWIEKVKFDTRPWANRSQEVGGDALAHLLKSIDAAAKDPDFLNQFFAQMKSVQQKLGSYIKSMDATRLNSVEDVLSLLDDAKEILITRSTDGRLGE